MSSFVGVRRLPTLKRPLSKAKKCSVKGVNARLSKLEEKLLMLIRLQESKLQESKQESQLMQSEGDSSDEDSDEEKKCVPAKKCIPAIRIPAIPVKESPLPLVPLASDSSDSGSSEDEGEWESMEWISEDVKSSEPHAPVSMNEMKEDSKDSTERKGPQCILCMDAMANHLFLPCCHLVMCRACVKLASKNPRECESKKVCQSRDGKLCKVCLVRAIDKFEDAKCPMCKKCIRSMKQVYY